jgi:hypothetical protein
MLHEHASPQPGEGRRDRDRDEPTVLGHVLVAQVASMAPDPQKRPRREGGKTSACVARDCCHESTARSAATSACEPEAACRGAGLRDATALIDDVLPALVAAVRERRVAAAAPRGQDDARRSVADAGAVTGEIVVSSRGGSRSVAAARSRASVASSSAARSATRFASIASAARRRGSRWSPRAC